MGQKLKKKTPTYNFTEEQLKIYLDNALKKKGEEIKNEAVAHALVLTLALPMEVLMDHYWKKTYRKRIPEFTKHVLEYYERWESGELDIEKLQEDLWEFGGVRFEMNEVESK